MFLVGNLGREFLNRVYLTSAILTIVVALITISVSGYVYAVGVVVGGAFAIINTMLLGNVIRAVVKPGQRDMVEIMVTVFLKFPVAIGCLIVALWLKLVDPIGFVIGFTCFPLSLLVAVTVSYYTKKRSLTSEVDELT